MMDIHILYHNTDKITFLSGLHFSFHFCLLTKRTYEFKRMTIALKENDIFNLKRFSHSACDVNLNT